MRPGAVVAALALLAISSLAALAVERVGASLHGDVPPGWPANGCLGASAAPVGMRLIVTGQASLCLADGGMHATLDLEHLEPAAPYTAWIAYFESPSLCSLGALIYQAYNFKSPCTLADLEGPEPRGIVRRVAETAADTLGAIHLDAPMPKLILASRAQAWLLLSRPYWSPLPYDTRGLTPDDTSKPVARMLFDLP